MDILARLDAVTLELLEQLRQVKAENKALREEKRVWHEDRAYLLGEIERILKRLDDVQLEES